MSNINTKGASFALVVAHMAGMIDLVALPVWVGTLISGFGYQPAQAGGLATLFLLGVVVSSVILSSLFHKVPSRWMPTLGFAISAAAFYSMTTLSGFGAFAVAHFVAGFATGIAISFTHGTMGRSGNPHRIFALGGLGLGIFGVVFLGGTPVLIADKGPSMLFLVFAIVMAFGAVVTAVFFPNVEKIEKILKGSMKFSKHVWFVIVAIVCMALVQAMIFSFLERMGADRGLTMDQIQGVLITLGLVAITPSILAVLLQNKLSALKVGVFGALVQALLAVGISWSSGFYLYAVSAVFFPFIMIFTHTFIFGHLAKIEPTGRANAATPAMIMTGSASAPLLGGVLVQTIGYPALGAAALFFGAIAVTLFAKSKA